jgi:hypothetical protein
MRFSNILKAILLTIIFAAVAAAFDPLLDGALTHRVGEEPRAVIASQINGDIYPDLVVANSGINDSTFSVLFNIGGVFTDAISYTVGTGSYALAAGDLNGDTRNDVAVAIYDENSVAVNLNTGIGFFFAPEKYAVGDAPSGIVAADFDGDLRIDLAAANYNSNNFSVLMNDNDTSFLAAVNYDAGNGPVAICTCNLDGNAYIDLAVASELGSSVTINLNNGDGTFTVHDTVSLGTGNTPRAVCSGDLDNNGYDDLIAACADTVVILFNNGDSTFAIPEKHVAGYHPGGVMAVDIDNDTDIDVITTSDSGYVAIMYNEADTALSPAVMYGTGYFGHTPYGICADDFDVDNDIDLATADFAADNVSILYNYGGGLFPSPTTHPAGAGAFGIVSADFDSSGYSDLAVSLWGNMTGGGGMVSLLFNNGDSTFTEGFTHSVEDNLGFICTADFDLVIGDDMAVTNFYDDSLTILLNHGDSTFGERVYYVGPGPYEIQAAHLDSDIYPDLVIGCYDSSVVAVLMGAFLGEFASPVFYNAGSWAGHVKCADFDGDGDIDIFAPNYYSDSVSILLNNGEGVFGSAAQYYAGPGSNSVYPADLDGDNDCDMVVTNHDADYITVMLNDGGAFWSSTYATGQTPYYIMATDLDFDSDSDLVIANQHGHNVTIMENDGLGAFTLSGHYGAGMTPQILTAFDLDNDNDKDLAICNFGSGGVTVLLNRTELLASPTAIDDREDFSDIPRRSVLGQNYPNPFNPTTVIGYSIDRRSRVDISIYNLLGRKVSTIVDKTLPAGEYTTEWDGRDDNGRPVASGIYFYQIRIGGYVESRKMLLLK